MTNTVPEDQAPFEDCAPAPGVCSVCGQAGPDLQPELRPTGANGREFTYEICGHCRQGNESDSADPFILQRWIVFLQYIVGGYRMARTFNGNQASQILPKEFL
jgi:hypothetical protein